MVLEFPVLKTCELRRTKWLNVKSVEIHAPFLDSFICEARVKAPLNDYLIKIIGASLSKFELSCGLQDRFIFNGSTVTCATLSRFRTITDRYLSLEVHRLFNELSSMACLILVGSVVKVFAQSNLGFPRYDKLERIEMIDGFNFNVLLELLRATPYLKFLEVDVVSLHVTLPSFPSNDCRYAVFDYDFTTEENCHKSKIFFISWSAETAKVRTKMLYASSKDRFRRELDGVQAELQATDPSEMSLDILKERAY